MLEDGRLFEGRSCGAAGTTTGEVCFNTAMTGYAEVLTDPSYHGQILTLTTPEVGVYGVSPEDFESGGIQVAGFIVRHLSRTPSNWRSRMSLADWLRDRGIVAVEDLDTRALTRHLRGRGAMRGVLTTDESLDRAALLELARGSAGVEGQDFTESVTRADETDWDEAGAVIEWYDLSRNAVVRRGRPLRILVYDFGLKANIARQLAARGCEVRVVPAATPAGRALELDPDGILLSNGPGDPAACQRIIEEVRSLVGVKPLGGICLGHQILALACGARTAKLPFGHRGSNHPVRVLANGRVLITSQNHGFTVRGDSLGKSRLAMTHVSLNDGTVEGFRHRELPVMAVQFHPEASPGPHDAHDDFFEAFLDLVETGVTTADDAQAN